MEGHGRPVKIVVGECHSTRPHCVTDVIVPIIVTTNAGYHQIDIVAIRRDSNFVFVSGLHWAKRGRNYAANAPSLTFLVQSGSEIVLHAKVQNDPQNWCSRGHTLIMVDMSLRGVRDQSTNVVPKATSVTRVPKSYRGCRNTYFFIMVGNRDRT